MSSRPARQLTILVPDMHMDTVLREAVAPLARDSGDGARVDVLFFHRHVKPAWNLRVHIAGQGEGFVPAVESRAEFRLTPLRDEGKVRSWEWTEPDPVWEELAATAPQDDVERLFHHDTAACLAWLACAAANGTSRSRREFSLLMTERTLDLLGFDREDRIAFYRSGCRLPFEQGTWTEHDRSTLDRRFVALRDSLRSLVIDAAREEESAWGGPEPASIARRCLSASRPHLERVHDACAGDRVRTAQVLCRRHANRLGIDGLAEAVLRYFMLRLHEEPAVDAP